MVTWRRIRCAPWETSAFGKTGTRIPCNWSPFISGRKPPRDSGRSGWTAPHTYQGFSTGRFVGDALMVNTTHLKQGWLRRNGLPESDQANMVEFIVRHGDHLVDTTVVNDPVFLTEPEVRSNDFFRQPADHGAWLYACDDGEQIIGRPPDSVPNYSFGAQPFAKEYSRKYKIPLLSGIAGAPSIYPEFETKLKAATDA